MQPEKEKGKLCYPEEEGKLKFWFQMRWLGHTGFFAWYYRFWSTREKHVFESKEWANYFHLTGTFHPNGGIYDWVGLAKSTSTRIELLQMECPESDISEWGFWLKAWENERADVGCEFRFKDDLLYSGSYEMPWKPFLFLRGWRVYNKQPIKLSDQLIQESVVITYTPAQVANTYRPPLYLGRNIVVN